MAAIPLNDVERAGLLDAIHAAILRSDASPERQTLRPEQLETIARHLDEMIDLVRQTRAARSETYQARMVQEICAQCRAQDLSGFCQARQDHVCSLFVHLRPIVQVIASFLSRRGDADFAQTHPDIEPPADIPEEPRMIRRILIAVNENRSSQFAMQVGVAMAAASRAQVRLVHVVFPSLLREWGLGDETPQTEALITAGEALLAGFRQSLPQDVTADTRLRQGRPADEIIAAAREWNADLIVIGDHRPRSLSTFALGNTSDAVVRHAPCPIVVARKTEWPPAPATLPNATCSTSPNGVDDA